MPEVFRFRNIVFYFYSKDHEPRHVHVRHAGRRVVIIIDTLEVKHNSGFRNNELELLCSKVKQNTDLIKEMWDEHFKKENS